MHQQFLTLQYHKTDFKKFSKRDGNIHGNVKIINAHWLYINREWSYTIWNSKEINDGGKLCRHVNMNIFLFQMLTNLWTSAICFIFIIKYTIFLEQQFSFLILKAIYKYPKNTHQTNIQKINANQGTKGENQHNAISLVIPLITL